MDVKKLDFDNIPVIQVNDPKDTETKVTTQYQKKTPANKKKILDKQGLSAITVFN